MAKPILDDRLWELIEPLLPPVKPRPFRYPGRKRVEDRAALMGKLFVLRTSIGWECLPQEMSCGSGMTCWRRLRDWPAVGVWQKIHRVFFERLQHADAIDWSRAAVDSGSVRAVGGARKQGQTRRIAVKQARNITSSPTPKASRSRPRAPQPTAVT